MNKASFCLLVIVAIALHPWSSQAQKITTFAGSSTAGYAGDGGQASAAQFTFDYGLKIDASGNLLVCDYANNVLRKIDGSGIITTIAGNNTAGSTGDGGPATAAELNGPAETAMDAAGNIYIADRHNLRVRKINTAGVISTYAGSGSLYGDGGQATAANIGTPFGIAVDAAGDLYISDGTHIRKVNTAGIITTIAGTTIGYSGDGGLATAAQFNSPYDMTFDGAGNLYICDYANNAIRKINTSGYISTIAGTGTAGYTGDGGLASAAELNQPISLSFDAVGNLFFTQRGNNVIREINTVGIISTFAGSGSAGYSGDGGPATGASFSSPVGVVAYGVGSVFVADEFNNVIRAVDRWPVFAAGAQDTFSICANVSETLNSLLAINDTDSAQTERWTVYAAPMHGTLSGFPYSAASTGVSMTPSGLVYTPNAGYTGTDTFDINISDWIKSATIRISVTVDVCGTLAVSGVGAVADDLNVYPNPSSGSFIVTLPAANEESTIAIMDVTGRVVETKAVPAQTTRFTFDLSNKPAGAYMVKVSAGDKIYRKKLVIE